MLEGTIWCIGKFKPPSGPFLALAPVHTHPLSGDSGDGFSVKQRVPLPLGLLGLNYPRFDLETFTSVRIPQLTSRFSVFGMQSPPRGLGGGGGLLGALGAAAQAPEDDSFTVHMQGVNAVIRL